MMTAAVLLTLGGSGFLTPAQGCERSDMVQGWYARYLNRQADPAGLDNWVRQLRNGASPEFVQAAILGSDEFYANCGRSPEGYVNGLYGRVLGRKPCRQEIAEWCGNLRRCGCRIKLAQQFLGSCRRELVIAPPVYQPPVAVPVPAYSPPPVVAVPAPVYAPRPVVVAPVQRVYVPVAVPAYPRVYEPVYGSSVGFRLQLNFPGR
jgi:hypothetical protein